MKSALIISKSEQSLDPLKALMESEGYQSLCCVLTSQKAKAAVRDSDFDVIIINTPILDSGGIDLSIELCSRTSSGVFVLMKDEVYDKCCDTLESKGVFAVKKPLNRTAFHLCLRVWEISRSRLSRLESDNLKLRSQLEEIKIIDRAKYALMQCLTMSEKQAHRYIEKQAMDMRISRLQVAQRVLSTYEL